MTGLALEGIFMTFVMFVLAVAPFVIIWRWPATLLTKSLMTVVALLFFTMILMSVGHTAAKGYANFTFSPCLDMLGKTLSDEKVDPADVSAVISAQIVQIEHIAVLTPFAASSAAVPGIPDIVH